MSNAIGQSYTQSIKYLKYDLMASIVVFLVAIPLCLGIALASGAPLISGLIAGIVGGIVVGLISQSSISVSGPAAGMVAIVLAAITDLGSFNTFLLALFISGIFQILIGSVRAGFIADYIPSNVIQGLLCAIGILIIIKQVPFAFTYTDQNGLLLEQLREASDTFSLEPLEGITHHINLGALIIALVSLTTLVFFDTTQNKLLKKFPGPIIVVIIAVLLNQIYAYFLPSIAQYTHELVNIPLNESFHSFLKQFQMPLWTEWKNPHVYFYAFLLASIASLEALLNLEAVEKLDIQHRYCSRNRELVAQGVGNMTSSLLGGLPVTSVVVRSSVNIQAGSRSKLSTIFHGILILIVISLIPGWINQIPLAALATILIYVGFKLTSPSVYKEMYKQGLSRFFPFVVTVIAIIATNLLTGVIVGLLISFFFILKKNSQIQLDIFNEKHPRGTIQHIVLPQHMSFLCKASLLSELDKIAANTHLIIDARHTKYIDRDIQEVLQIFIKKQAPNKNIALNVLGFKENYHINNRVEFLSVTTYDTQISLTPIDILEVLKEGNKRFINDQRIHRSLPNEIKATSIKQHPIAIVIGCIDSRVPIETIFDMGVGDIFVARIAGNVIDNDIIASAEFACHVAGAKLIVVLGHTMCGAIRAACSNQATGHLGMLLGKIKKSFKTPFPENMYDPGFIHSITQDNIQNSMRTLYKQSVVLNQLIADKQIGLIGALYDVRSGVVHFDNGFFNNDETICSSSEINLQNIYGE